MSRKYFVLVSLVLALVASLVAGASLALAGAGPVWQPDFEINVYGWRPEVTAGQKFDITISAGSEAAGVAADEDVQLWLSSGKIVQTGGSSWAPWLDATGSLTATIVFTQTGSASLTVAVGADQAYNYTVQAGNTLAGIAAAKGDRYPAIYERNKTIVGEDPSRLSPGQVLNVVRYAPSRTLELTVLPDEPNHIKWLSPVDLQAVAGELLVLSGEVLDEYGNPTASAITVTLGSEEFALNANPLEVQASQIYTKTGLVTLTVVTPAGKVLADSNIEVVPGEPARLEVSGPTEAEVGTIRDVSVKVTDKFDNPTAGQVVAMGDITTTTNTSGEAIFSHKFPTVTGQVELDFEAAGLKASHAVTVTAGPLVKVQPFIQLDGAIAVYGYDGYRNPKAGEPVTITIHSAVSQETIRVVTVVPAEQAAAPAAAPVAPPAAVPAVAPAAALAAPATYTVVAGDNLWTIWKSLGSPGEWTTDDGAGWKDLIMATNGLEYNEAGIVVIQPGQILTLPSAPLAGP